jgi:ribosomal protein S18 acetylase RimI-like enzyme
LDTHIVIAEKPELLRELGGLSQILHACVHEGASVGFVLPFELADAEAYWRASVAPALDKRDRRLFLARLGGKLIGSVQLGLATPPNQPHRAELAMLLVHPGAHRMGVARALIGALEVSARAEGRRLITLETRSGDRAEPLLLSMGYEVAARIPGYVRDPRVERYDAMSFLFKPLAP